MMTNGVEKKVAAGGAVTVLSGMISWGLVAWVPAFHSGLPPQLASFLPWAGSAVLGTAAAYLAKHTPRPDDVAGEAISMVSRMTPALEDAAAASSPPSPAPGHAPQDAAQAVAPVRD